MSAAQLAAFLGVSSVVIVTPGQDTALTIRNILHSPDIVGTVEIFDLADLQALRDQINNDAVANSEPNPGTVPRDDVSRIDVAFAAIHRLIHDGLMKSKIAATSLHQQVAVFIHDNWR